MPEARVAELVDALVSGTSGSNLVQVRVLSRARPKSQHNLMLTLFFLSFVLRAPRSLPSVRRESVAVSLNGPF